MAPRTRTTLLAGAALFASSLTSAALAGNITFFQFASDPDFFSQPKEFVYNPATGLSAGPGATGNGGNFGVFSPGLLGTITGGLQGITSSPPGYGGPGPNYYILSDLTLTLTDFNAVGNAIVGSDSITQGLSNGSFTLKYHDHTTGNDLILLRGSTNSAVLTEKNTGNNASVLSGIVTYVPGDILTSQFADAGLGYTGSFSFAMTAVRGAYTTVLVNGEQRLAAFDADGAGTFDAVPFSQGGPSVPMPAAVWSGASLLGLLGAAKFKKRRSEQD